MVFEFRVFLTLREVVLSPELECGLLYELSVYRFSTVAVRTRTAHGALLRGLVRPSVLSHGSLVAAVGLELGNPR